MNHGQPEIGTRFGMLTVQEQLPSDKSGKRRYLCLCDCGKETAVIGHNLTQGHTKSCGCIKQQDLVGMRFGKLTVLSLSDKRAPRGARTVPLWECRCDCGNITYKATDTLKNGEISMCSDCAPLYASEKMRDCAGYVGGTQISRLTSTKLISTNTSGCRGVYFDKTSGMWRARLKFKGKLLNFGSYQNFEDAVKARKEAEERVFGEFLETVQPDE